MTFALDWAPNTNHIGVYVADQLGYFAEAGIDLEILPYGSTPASQLVSAGEADFGIGGQATVQLGRTAGLDLVSVYRVTQTDTGALVTLGDRTDITRPADLDGLVFGGFGSPLYSAMAKTVIVNDGGAGDFTEVVLDSGAYDALEAGRIDFTLAVTTWEGVKVELEGNPFQTFSYQDFGMPQQQATGIVSSNAYLEANPELAAAFVQAVQRGYQYAVDNPQQAAQLLIEANPDTLSTSVELVERSTELLASTDGYFAMEGRDLGAADPTAWAEYGAFLFENGYLVDAQGAPVTVAPDWSEYYTDDLLK